MVESADSDTVDSMADSEESARILRNRPEDSGIGQGRIHLQYEKIQKMIIFALSAV